MVWISSQRLTAAINISQKEASLFTTALGKSQISICCVQLILGSSELLWAGNNSNSHSAPLKDAPASKFCMSQSCPEVLKVPHPLARPERCSTH